jgi:hypothetical protein
MWPAGCGLIMTEIKQDFAGDARFPDYDRQWWKQREAHTAEATYASTSRPTKG